MTEPAAELAPRSEPRPGVVQLTSSPPDKLNALTEPLVTQLHGHLRDLSADLPGGRADRRGPGVLRRPGPGRFRHNARLQEFGRTHQTRATQRGMAALVQEIRRLTDGLLDRSRTDGVNACRAGVARSGCGWRTAVDVSRMFLLTTRNQQDAESWPPRRMRGSGTSSSCPPRRRSACPSRARVLAPWVRGANLFSRT
jgi:hypothetical protein